MSDELKTPGLVSLTPELMEKISQSLDRRMAHINERFPKLVEECPYETKLAVVAWVFKQLCEHANDGGSFRGLIYERLGFEADAYVPLYDAGGMTISNEFVITVASPEDVEIAERLEKSLWPRRGPEPTPVIFEGGKEPWLTVCAAVQTIRGLSSALAAEQEKRRRIESELAIAVIGNIKDEPC